MTRTGSNTPAVTWRIVGLCFSIATLIGLLTAIEAKVSQDIMGNPVTWALALRRSFEEWYLFGLLALGIVWLGRRFPLHPGRVWSWVGTHLAFGAVFALVYIVGLSVLLAGQTSVQDGSTLTFEGVFQKIVLHYFVADITMYWMVLLAQHGWFYYQQFREREVRSAELERQLTQARLDALRMQLNPHFLFNTLHAVSALVHTNPDAAERVVARLSELLRLTLDQNQPQEIPLSDELAFLQRYLEIEQTRFGDRLEVAQQIDPGVRDALLPPLILQPLVENAIRHGIEQREEKGRLTISARRNGTALELCVSDNGPGLPKVPSPSTSRPGVGLANTRSRLKHLYGECQALDLRETPGGGLSACIQMPFRTTRDPVPQPASAAVAIGCNAAPVCACVSV